METYRSAFCYQTNPANRSTPAHTAPSHTLVHTRPHCTLTHTDTPPTPPRTHSHAHLHTHPHTYTFPQPPTHPDTHLYTPTHPVYTHTPSYTPSYTSTSTHTPSHTPSHTPPLPHTPQGVEKTKGPVWPGPLVLPLAHGTTEQDVSGTVPGGSRKVAFLPSWSLQPSRRDTHQSNNQTYTRQQ